MKCWRTNKRNLANRHKSHSKEDGFEYGSVTDAVMMISAVSSICEQKKNEGSFENESASTLFQNSQRKAADS